MSYQSSFSKKYLIDLSDGFVPLVYWFVAEAGLSTLVICLPAILQLLKRVHSFGPSSLFNAKDYTRIASPAIEERDMEGKSRSHSPLARANGNDRKISGCWQNMDVDLEPLQSIHVQKDSGVGAPRPFFSVREVSPTVENSILARCESPVVSVSEIPSLNVSRR